MRSIMLRGVRARILTALALSAVSLACVGLASPAQAHVTANLYGATATSGGYGAAFFRVPHGCGGDATNAVSITMPDGIAVSGVKPQAKAGWKITQGADSITWSGGALKDDEFDDFGVNLKWPTLAAGETSRKVYFRTVQTCGAEVALKTAQGRTTIMGSFPANGGQEVSIFAQDRRIGRSTLGSNGELRFDVPEGKIPVGTEVRIQRGGQVLGNSTPRTESWIAIPGDGNDPAMPAPSVTVVAGGSGH